MCKGEKACIVCMNVYSVMMCIVCIMVDECDVVGFVSMCSCDDGLTLGMQCASCVGGCVTLCVCVCAT